MGTLNSTKMQLEEKVNNLKDLIATKIPRYGSWLLVVDNVNSSFDVHDFLPRPGNNQWTKGQLLITTQNTSSIPSESFFVSHISVSEGMTPKDASSFLEKVSGISQHGVEDKVAEALDYQPLALASAGVYVRKVRESQIHRNFGWKEYLEKLERGMRTHTETKLIETNPCYGKSMTVATRIAIERAVKNDSVLKKTFTLLSLCSPQPLHLDIVMNYILIDKELNSDREEIALQIEGYSLLMFEEREDGVFVSMHGVVHEVSKSVINECQDHYEHLYKLVLTVTSFNQFIDTHLPNTWHDQNSIRDSEHLIPHLTTFAGEVKNVFLQQNKDQVIKEDVLNYRYSELLEFFRRLAIICRNHREFSSAKAFCETALKLVERVREEGDCESTSTSGIELKELGPTPVALVAIYNLLGTVQRELGEFQNSEENHKRALDIEQKNLGPEHVDVARTLHHLGNVQHDLGNLEKAMEYYKCALEIQQKNLGHDHIYFAFSFFTMGVVESELGNLQSAKNYFERALNIRLKTYEDKDVYVARIYDNLGDVERELDDLPLAKNYWELALKIRLEKLGPKHVDVAHTYHNLGDVQRELDDLQKSNESYECALNIWLKKLGPDHVNVSRTFFGLANVQRDLGNLRQAKEYCERALKIELRKLGPEHDDVALTYSNLGGQGMSRKSFSCKPEKS
ncbi:kinesin light chain 1-like [Stylophora pistillata]|uniref:kinesin light chain 1-like n=1 Tax=Stylophora pistillata TaxID=50429 RepID=UPI000C057697|nr:kinesin light chain 1-like [Stylophora pistillata]